MFTLLSAEITLTENVLLFIPSNETENIQVTKVQSFIYVDFLERRKIEEIPKLAGVKI